MSTVRSILAQKEDKIISVSPDDSLLNAVVKLDENKIGAVVVLDKKGNLKGILSERDVVRNMAKKGEAACAVTVSHLMTKGVMYVKLHQSLDECLKLMIDNNFRHLPVLEDDKVIGMISIRDVMKAVLEEKAFQIDQLEYYITTTY